jgi:hypothetical protein
MVEFVFNENDTALNYIHLIQLNEVFMLKWF